MKYGFVGTQERVYSYDGTYLGGQVFQVQDTTDGLVDIPPNYFWVECADDTVAADSYYDLNDNQIKAKPIPAQPQSTGTQTL
jgi:hypothetical protein